MEGPKFTGSYYTPEILSDFLVSHVFNKYISEKKISILEPSCGDGQFVKSLFEHLDLGEFDELRIDLIDIDEDELLKAVSYVPQNVKVSLNVTATDYLDSFYRFRKKYDVIIGNPPYIRKKHLKKSQIELCEKCHDVAKNESNLFNSKFKINNIWTAFVESSLLSLNDNGILCFVLPSDILQVNYASELREYIKSVFDRVEIFSFNELVFEGIQQDVIAIIGIKNIIDESKKGFAFYHVEMLNDLKEPTFTQKYNNTHRTNLHKWTNYLLSPNDLDFVDFLRKDLPLVNDKCLKISAGIVTAGNDFFIVNNTTLIKEELKAFKGLNPILLKGSQVGDLINFRIEDYEILKKNDERVFFLDIPEAGKDKLPKEITNYIVKAEESKVDGKSIDERFKMTQRKFWYAVPNTWKSSGLFVKRCSEYPKVIKNDAEVFSTDSFYRIVPKNNIDIKSIVFSFYNSLTLLLAELEGRYYGGGVLELTPNEFKKLSFPFRNDITDEQFDRLDNLFRCNTDIDTILDYTDSILLSRLSRGKIQRLRDLRLRLLHRRKKHIPETLLLEAI